MKKYIWGALIALLVSVQAQARFITDFRSNVKKDESGRVIFEAVPSAWDMYRPANTKTWKVWGVLICYTVDGKRKALRQDITPGIMRDGKYTIPLSYSRSATVRNIEAEYFEVGDPESSWPTKESCL